jgi:hypothetical protein
LNYRCKNKWFETKVEKKDFNLGADAVSASWGRGNLVIFHLWIKKEKEGGQETYQIFVPKIK